MEGVVGSEVAKEGRTVPKKGDTVPKKGDTGVFDGLCWQLSASSIIRSRVRLRPGVSVAEALMGGRTTLTGASRKDFFNVLCVLLPTDDTTYNCWCTVCAEDIKGPRQNLMTHISRNHPWLLLKNASVPNKKRRRGGRVINGLSLFRLSTTDIVKRLGWMMIFNVTHGMLSFAVASRIYDAEVSLLTSLADSPVTRSLKAKSGRWASSTVCSLHSSLLSTIV